MELEQEDLDELEEEEEDKIAQQEAVEEGSHGEELDETLELDSENEEEEAIIGPNTWSVQEVGVWLTSKRLNNLVSKCSFIFVTNTVCRCIF